MLPRVPPLPTPGKCNLIFAVCPSARYTTNQYNTSSYTPAAGPHVVSATSARHSGEWRALPACHTSSTEQTHTPQHAGPLSCKHTHVLSTNWKQITPPWKLRKKTDHKLLKVTWQSWDDIQLLLREKHLYLWIVKAVPLKRQNLLIHKHETRLFLAINGEKSYEKLWRVC